MAQLLLERFRIYANYLINFAASLVTIKFLTDLGSGLNMFKVSYLKNRFYLDFPNDLTFNYCLIFLPLCISPIANVVNSIVIINAIITLVNGGVSAIPSVVKRIPFII